MERPAKWICAIALLTFFVALPVRAGEHHTCHSEYRTAYEAAGAELDESSIRTVQPQIRKAWDFYWRGKDAARRDAALDAVLAALLNGRVIGFHRESKALVASLVGEFKLCMSTRAAAGLGSLTIRTFELNESMPGLKGAPAGPGVKIYVNDTWVADADPTGAATIAVPAGRSDILALIPSQSMAREEVDIAEGATEEIELVLDDSKDVQFDASVDILGIVDGLMPLTLPTLEMRVRQGEVTRPLTEAFDLEIRDGGALVYSGSRPGHLVVSPSGTVMLDDFDHLKALLAERYHGKELTLELWGADDRNFTYYAKTAFYVQRNALLVELQGPRSRPDLPLADVVVTYQLMGTALRLDRTTVGGAVDFGMVPLGNTKVTATVMHAGIAYHGHATFFSDRGYRLVMTLRGPAELTDKEPSFTLASDRLVHQRTTRRRPARSIPLVPRALPLDFERLGETGGATVRVASHEQDRLVTRSATLSAPMGATKLLLRYRVATAEYPEWVMQQSIYNDFWALRLIGPAGEIHQETSRNVNAQLNGEPPWMADGATPMIEDVFDISALTGKGPATFTLVASAMNVGDSILPTDLSAVVNYDEEALVVKDVRPENLRVAARNQRTFSIPLLGQANTTHRWFTMKVEKPEGATITRVKGELLHTGGGGPLDVLFDEAPGNNVVIEGEDRLRARVSFAEASTIVTIPPPAHNILYRFTVYATDASGAEISGVGTSALMRALWRMPPYWREPLRRYGTRDHGEDDWLNARTWDYLGRHGELITRIDDISGEHGREIGHDTHDTGADIDVFHMVTMPGATSGRHNHRLLREALARVLNDPGEQTAADRALLDEWVARTRDRFEMVLETTDAEKIYYSIGAPGDGLEKGWAKTLLLDGAISVGDASYDSGQGWWSYDQSRLRYDTVHNTHWHLTRPRDR